MLHNGSRYLKQKLLAHMTALLVTGIFVSLTLLYIVWNVLGLTIAVQGAYLTIGLTIALVLNWWSSPTHTPIDGSLFRNYRLIKLYLVLLLASFALIVATGSRLVGPLVCLPPLLVLLAVQLLSRKHLRLFPFQTGAYLGVVGVTKYAATDFYFGRGDILTHLPRVHSVLEADGVNKGLELYIDFPGLHVLVAAVNHVTGLVSYDALIITGILTYATVILIVYIIVAELSDNNTYVASCISFSAVLTVPVIYYMIYFFPQSYATALILLLIFLSVRMMSSHKRSRRRFVPVGLVIGITLILTHHLTIFLFTPLLLTVTVGYSIGSRLGFSRSHIPFYPFLGFILSIGIVYYWLFHSDWFLLTLFGVLTAILSNVLKFSGPVTTEQGFLLYAHEVPQWMNPVYQSLTNLFSPLGLHFSLLLPLFVLGVFHALSVRWSRNLTGFIIAGFLAAFVVFPNPIALSIKSLVRLRFAWIFVFIFVIGAGVARITNSTGKTRRDTLLVCFVVIVGVTAAFAAADHIQVYDTPRDQSTMTTGEFRSHEMMNSFIETGSGYDNVTALWLSSVTLNLFGDDVDSRALQNGAVPVERGLSVEEGLFVYRQSWSEYYVRETSSEIHLNRLVIQKKWLQNAVSSEQKVYTTGDTGIIWSSEQRVFAPDSTADV